MRALPVGHGIVTFDLTESGSGTLVRMEERGPCRPGLTGVRSAPVL